ncbi:hypothetical protein M0813_27208 [Anaeramoeba flamelloides]|uniref:Uncharacterized protein n=1 Tax=Anaeramoeba flamelloides TaxID=1746091 RepID=A0ABQ8Y1S9_9EUKA|nr:hypothetical protein M0813_27208 [Anaeramoeba flamelloides]
MTDLKFKRFRHSNVFRSKISETNLDITLDHVLSGNLCVNKLCSVGRLSRFRSLQTQSTQLKKFRTIGTSNVKQTKNRIQNKTSVEKVALQGLCLLKDRLFIPDLYSRKSTNGIRSVRKRSYNEQMQYKPVQVESKIVQTQLELELEKPIDNNGSICIKGTQNFSFACPSTYPIKQNN